MYFLIFQLLQRFSQSLFYNEVSHPEERAKYFVKHDTVREEIQTLAKALDEAKHYLQHCQDCYSDKALRWSFWQLDDLTGELKQVNKQVELNIFEFEELKKDIKYFTRSLKEDYPLEKQQCNYSDLLLSGR